MVKYSNLLKRWTSKIIWAFLTTKDRFIYKIVKLSKVKFYDFYIIFQKQKKVVEITNISLVKFSNTLKEWISKII